MSEIALSFAQTIASHHYEKIKVCENKECQFFFFDTSKNNSKKFCCTKCANLIKVRRFREKQKK
ncbi:CGNR zinc finger domain-containing protein [Bacillus solimangrovi]|uniref:Zinc finger CGNR domain-containing protein n=1 Tax=Bacillus solimangrovi TaxID=1305675 RepID=A0A1E5LF10_9BACI|nr:hypothetical protein BFG57_01265 [Bacillus solimangrovi]